MKSSLRLTLFGLVTCFATFALAAPPLVNLIDENSPLVVSVQDTPQFIKNGSESPWAKLWNDEQVRKFIAPLREKMKVDRWDEECKAETGHSLTELLAMAKGQLLLALTSADVFELGENPEPSKVPLLLAVELGENTDRIAKIIAESDEKNHAEKHLEDYAGVPVHVYQVKAENGGGDVFAWAMVDGIWFLSPSKTEVQHALDHLKKGRAAAPFGESERFLKSRKQAPDADLTVMLNIQALYPAARQAIDKRAQEKGTQPMGLTPGILMEALGIDALRELYLSLTFSPDGTVFDGGLTCSEQRGLLKMLAFNDGPVPQPAFVSEKWINVSAARFSIPSMYASLKEILNTLNPMLGSMLQGQIRQFNQQLGIDIERDLISSLGDQMLAAKALKPGANPEAPPPMDEIEQLIVISLENAPAFTKAVEALKRTAGPQAEKMFIKREYLGQGIHTLDLQNPKPGQKPFSYAITPSYLLVAIGSPGILETAIQGLDGKQPSLWRKAEVKAALAEVPASACSFEYQDTRILIGSVFETFVKLASRFTDSAPPALEDEGGDEPTAAPRNESLLDLSAKPDASKLGQYFGITTGYAWRDSNGLYVKSKAHKPK